MDKDLKTILQHHFLISFNSQSETKRKIEEDGEYEAKIDRDYIDEVEKIIASMRFTANDALEYSLSNTQK